MLSRKKLSVFLALFLCVAASLSLIGLSRVLADTKTLKVGVILPLSGEAASIGNSMRNGMLMAYERLEPQMRERLQLVYEDDALLPSNSIKAFNKLLASDGIQLIVTAGSGSSNVVAPLAEEAQIPMLAIASDPKVVKDRKYVMNFWVTPEEETKVALSEARRRGYKKIARIVAQSDFTLTVKEVFDQQNAGQIEIKVDEELPTSIKDFRSLLTKIRANKDLDAILVLLHAGQTGIFAKQARQMGVKLPLFNYEFFEDRNEVEASQGALIGQWYVNAAQPDDSFLKEYRQRFPGASQFGASNGHDLVLLIAEALKQSLDRHEINSFLHTVKDIRGVNGTFSASNDNRFTLPAAALEVTEDGFKSIS